MKYKLKTTIFETDIKPMCNLCGSDLLFNIIKIKSEPHNNINGCLNETCESNLRKLGRKENWKAFLPGDEYKKISEKMYDVMMSNNRLKTSFWIKKGLSEEEAKLKIFEIQSENSNKVKNRFIVSKYNLKSNGYSDDEILNVCQTPSMLSFWIKKGFTEEEAKIKLNETQSNAAKHVDFEKRLLPSNKEYWMERGFDEEESKKKVSDSQRTFSLKICIQKHGPEEGLVIYNNRQQKWQKSLYENGNIKGGYSKISQELFDILSTKLDGEFYYATKSGEYCISDDRNYYFDFTDLKSMKIIEYNGDQYHANPKIYEPNDYPHPYRKESGYSSKDIWEMDRIKGESAKISGFDVLYIWDSEYKKNKEYIIQKCIDFIKTNK
jgi:hypothetical protein